uniref:Uncharacterized protein n=1 Tax=Glycine max TaxID=3847 RepID=C6T154_SOYBN|nr:unknown [Glycine max]
MPTSPIFQQQSSSVVLVIISPLAWLMISWCFWAISSTTRISRISRRVFSLEKLSHELKTRLSSTSHCGGHKQ